MTSAEPFGDQDMWMIEVTSLPVTQEQVNAVVDHLIRFKNLLVGYSIKKGNCDYIQRGANMICCIGWLI